MAKQTVNIGASANDGTGDTIREAFNKVNDNFTEVYDNIDVANSVETDTSPALGGDLDVNGFSIVANTGTGVINIVPSTAGYLRLDGIKIDGTTITTHTNNTNITLDPHGTGKVLAEKIAFTGGTIDGVTIGATQPPTGTFDVLTVNTALQATGGSIDDIMIGSTTPSTGAFTSLEASEINADLINMAGHIIPTVDVSYDLGSPLLKWSELYVDVINGNSINLTGIISGTFTGDVTGDVTGNLFGNADTATALQTAREINGVSFDGTADITVTADANTLSNTTLNSTVVNSSLTSVGTLTGLTIGLGAAIDAGNNVIANVADPLTNQDAANKLYVDTAITNLIDGAVPALDTLKEIADSLNNDTDIATTIVNGLAAKLDTAGGTMTGELYLNADPVSGTEAATKNYVDTQVSSAISAATTISSDDTSVVVTDNGVVDGKVEITVDGGLMVTVGPANISVESHRIVDVTDPSGPQDAATKKYVDDQIDGLATVASSGQYSDLSGTPTLALVATSGNYIDLNSLPDLENFSADTIYAITQIHTAGAMLSDSISVKNYVAVGELDSGALSRLDITDAEASGAIIQQVKNNLLDINSQGTLALSSTGDLTIQGLVYPATDGSAGDVVVTDGAGTLSFATLSYLPLSGGELTGKLLAVQGAGTAGGYSFGGTEGGADTGMFSNADGVLDFYADNNKIVTIESTGVTYTQAITLPGDPTNALEAATKQYVDDGIGALATVATSGAYSDLSGTPTIPADISDLTDTTNLLFDGAYSSLSGAPTILAEPAFSVKTTNFNVDAGSRYGVDTSAGAVTATLPASPTAGDAVFFADAGGAYSTNNLTVARNGNTIMGSASDLTVSTNNESFGLFYNGTTWRLY